MYSIVNKIRDQRSILKSVYFILTTLPGHISREKSVTQKIKLIWPDFQPKVSLSQVSYYSLSYLLSDVLLEMHLET